MVVVVDGSPLTIQEVVAVAHRTASVESGNDLASRMEPARALVERIIADEDVAYGITTGFGALSYTRIPIEQASELQYDLVRSHASGVGDLLGRPAIRAMLLLRARTLAQGHSGVRPAVVERLIEFLRRDLLPAVPDRGSVGASGDLAPFAHLALPLIGEGFFLVDGARVAAADVLEAEGLDPIELRPKEGLSLLNGTEGMLAQGCLAVHAARLLADAADGACALSVEALMGSSRPFQARVHHCLLYTSDAADDRPRV